VLEDGQALPRGLGVFLRGAQVSVAGADAVRIALPPGSPGLERLGERPVRRALEEALGARLGRPVTLAAGADEAAQGGGSTPPRITAESARHDRLRRLTEKEPPLAAAVEAWDLELVD
jgi:hypothetical protein